MNDFFLPVALSGVIGGVASYVYWDLVTMRHWRTGPHVEAYEQRLVERDRRRPFDEAWSEWLAADETSQEVLIDAVMAGFERRVVELEDRSRRSSVEVPA